MMAGLVGLPAFSFAALQTATTPAVYVHVPGVRSVAFQLQVAGSADWTALCKILVNAKKDDKLASAILKGLSKESLETLSRPHLYEKLSGPIPHSPQTISSVRKRFVDDFNKMASQVDLYPDAASSVPTLTEEDHSLLRQYVKCGVPGRHAANYALLLKAYPLVIYKRAHVPSVLDLVYQGDGTKALVLTSQSPFIWSIKIDSKRQPLEIIVSCSQPPYVICDDPIAFSKTKIIDPKDGYRKLVAESTQDKWYPVVVERLKRLHGVTITESLFPDFADGRPVIIK